MKSITLTFALRVKLSSFLGQMRGLSLDESRGLGKLFDEVNFSAKEQVDIDKEILGGGRAQFTPKGDAEVFRKTVQVEAVVILTHKLREHRDYGPGEAQWVDAILEALCAAEPAPREGGKSGKKSV